ncbi:MAG: CDP-diacylglycerol--glycerol-3-phosphate 3-phosphatidyltransferase [Desulfococcaceae bacterium]|jgi:CDP-diacylglycerol--glycerol-3-phosphate 3-phosphatidyltransferase|nr:CDP-diacylglycerol--glycerol-3-phosphate 3-phosphatidyltransferase [Desulfococcaceae bacterium]
MRLKEKLLQLFSNPNFLTLFRMAAAPGIVCLLLVPNRFTSFLAAILFSLAAISDYLDGFFARKWGLTSNFGKVMDPVADKLVVSSSFIMLVSLGWIPAWVICIIIGRELAVSGLRSIVAESGEDVSASWLGKYKTGFQIAAIIPLLIHSPYFGINFHAIGMFFLWGALIFTIWSGTDYFFRFRKLLQT